MAYMQKPGRGPLANKKVEALTNGIPLKQQSRYERAKEIANKKSYEDGGTSYYTGSMGSSSGSGRASGKTRDIGSYVYNFAKEMISPSKPTKKETKGSGFGGRGY